MTIFDILNSISYTKEDLSERDDFERVYSPFMVNRFLSMSNDTIGYVKFINRYPNIPRKDQYKFYLKMVSPKKRFFKYSKKTVDDGCRFIMEYFNVGYQEALNIKSMLSPQEINIIDDMFKDLK